MGVVGRSRAVGHQQAAQGEYQRTGGMDDDAPVFSVDASSGTPLYVDRRLTSLRALVAIWAGVICWVDQARCS